MKPKKLRKRKPKFKIGDIIKYKSDFILGRLTKAYRGLVKGTSPLIVKTIKNNWQEQTIQMEEHFELDTKMTIEYAFNKELEEILK